VHPECSKINLKIPFMRTPHAKWRGYSGPLSKIAWEVVSISFVHHLKSKVGAVQDIRPSIYDTAV
jgi:hypothetical protein